jgi:ABC-type antimicrobial peptide transport system permease subunit
MGIRIALGATFPQALRTLAIPGIALAAVGVAIGAGAALLFARLLEHFVWGVTTHDAITFAGVALALLLVASIASVVPALKILRIDPSNALRVQ